MEADPQHQCASTDVHVHHVVPFLLSPLRGKRDGQKGEGKNATLQACLLFSAVMLIAGIAQGAESPYKIRIGFPSLAFSYMPYYVAQEKGIYKKYGIESEYIQMTSAIQPQAVVAGNINYFTSVSTGISAAVAGSTAGHRHQLLRRVTLGAGNP